MCSHSDTAGHLDPVTHSVGAHTDHRRVQSKRESSDQSTRDLERDVVDPWGVIKGMGIAKPTGHALAHDLARQRHTVL